MSITIVYILYLHFQALHAPPPGEAEAMCKCNEPMGGQNLQNVQLKYAGQYSSSVCMFSLYVLMFSHSIHSLIVFILFQEEGVATVTKLHMKSDPGAASQLKMVLKDLHTDARFLNYVCT